MPQLPSLPEPTDEYLEIDTRTSAMTKHENMEDLRAAAVIRGTTLQLMTLEDAFRKAQLAADPGRVFLTVLFAPLLVASGVLLYMLIRLRQRSSVNMR